jgi:hypothetical protein
MRIGVIPSPILNAASAKTDQNYAPDTVRNYRNREEEEKAEYDEMQKKRCELLPQPMIGKRDYGSGGGVGLLRSP